MCFDCYRQNRGEPKHCKKCGAVIPERYIYCWECAMKDKLMKEGEY